MRTKALILAAAFVAAGVASSMAQVYSANAVGYVNLSLVPGFTVVANPLNGTNNSLNTILPLPDTADGTTIFRFKPAIQNYGEPITFVGGFGWFTTDEDPNWLDLAPGEGVFVQNVGATPLNVTFVGEVLQGQLSNPILGTNKFSIVASQVPQALPLGSRNEAGTLEFPAFGDDVVFIFDPAVQNYKDNFTFIDGYGWFTATDDPGPAGPVIPVATGFFVQKNGPDTSWDRNFSVNN